MRGARSPCPTATKTRGSRARSESTGRSKSNRRLLPRNSTWFNLVGSSGGRKTRLRGSTVPRERASEPRFALTNLSTSFGISTKPRGGSFTGCHFPRAAHPLPSDSPHAGKGRRGLSCSVRFRRWLMELRKDKQFSVFLKPGNPRTCRLFASFKLFHHPAQVPAPPVRGCGAFRAANKSLPHPTVCRRLN